MGPLHFTSKGMLGVEENLYHQDNRGKYSESNAKVLFFFSFLINIKRQKLIIACTR